MSSSGGGLHGGERNSKKAVAEAEEFFAGVQYDTGEVRNLLREPTKVSEVFRIDGFGGRNFNTEKTVFCVADQKNRFPDCFCFENYALIIADEERAGGSKYARTLK